MTNVEYQTRQLIREIKKSNEYNQFQRLSKKMAREPELKEKIDQFRQKRFTLQTDEEAGEAELQSLEADNADLLAKSSVREYLISEQKLCFMVQNTLLAIAQAVDLDLEL